jgi:cobalt/nickel transport system permease protein
MLAGLVSLFASSEPDGLERVAADQGFAEKGEGTPAWNAPLPDYTVAGREEKWPKAAAGVLGTVVVFGAAYGLGRLLMRRKARANPSSRIRCAHLGLLPQGEKVTSPQGEQATPEARAAAGSPRGLDSRVKILACLVLILLGVTTPPERCFALAAYLLLGLGVLLLSGAGLRAVLWRLLLVLPAVALVAAGLLFCQESGDSVDLHAVPGFLGGAPAGATPRTPGLLLWNVAAKAMLGVLSLSALLLTTSLASVLEGLGRLRVPSVFVHLAGFTYRYLFLFREEARRLWRARAARCYRGRWLWQAGGLGALLGTLFLRGYERSERVYLAMLARGFEGGAPRTAPRPLRARDYAFLAASAGVLAAVRWAAP